MKGQLSYEYYVSLLIFLLASFYVMLKINQYLPPFKEFVLKQRIYSEAYQLSEILVNDPGEPPDWNLSNVKRIGLQHQLKKKNLVSSYKINLLNESCEKFGYSFIKDKLGVPQDVDFRLSVFKDDKLLVSCGIDKRYSIKESLSRTVYIDGKDYGKVVVEVFK